MDKDSGTSKSPLTLPPTDSVPRFSAEPEEGGGGETAGSNITKPCSKARDEELVTGLDGDYFTSVLNPEEKNGSENNREEEEVEDDNIPGEEGNMDFTEHPRVAILDNSSRKIKTGVGTDGIQRASQNGITCEAEVFHLNQTQVECPVDFVPNTASCCGDTPVTLEHDRTKPTYLRKEDLFSLQKDADQKCMVDSCFESYNNGMAVDGDHTLNQTILAEDENCANEISTDTDSKVPKPSGVHNSGGETMDSDHYDQKTTSVNGYALKIVDGNNTQDADGYAFKSSSVNDTGQESIYTDGNGPKTKDMDGIRQELNGTDGYDNKLDDIDGISSKFTYVDGYGPESIDADSATSTIADANCPKSTSAHIDNPKLTGAFSNGSVSTHADNWDPKSVDIGDNCTESDNTDGNGQNLTDADRCGIELVDACENGPNLTDIDGDCNINDACRAVQNTFDACGGVSNSIHDDCESAKSTVVCEIDLKSTDMEINGAADAHQENFAKVVTFSEDKEVFDMGYVLPASVTVHLDTPVSSIAPGDVQISTDPADPVCEGTVYPISGILKTDDGVDCKEEHDQQNVKHEPASENAGFEAGENIPARTEQDKDSKVCSAQGPINSPIDMLHGRADVFGNSALELDGEKRKNAQSPIADSSQDSEGCLTSSVDICNEENNRNGAEDSANSPKAEEISASTSTRAVGMLTAADYTRAGLEEDDCAGHRGFVVEAVAENELQRGLGIMPSVGAGKLKQITNPQANFDSCVDSGVPLLGEAASHSTDSNYQDTIGPLDNPQFLKTLNYTARLEQRQQQLHLISF